MSSHEPTTENYEGIAIVAMSGRFPGAPSIDEFWRNLIAGRETISRFREDELEFTASTPEAKANGQRFVGARGILEGVDLFDASFFGIFPKEAEIMDPQHRLFLECAWESLESAGYDPEAYPGMIGVFGGLSMNTYLLSNLCRDREFASSFSGNYQVGAYQVMLGNDKDFMPTRVSYKLNLRGPSISIQCACSTSLVAISQACTNLLTYQCDMALAGGASISFPQKRDYLYQEEAMVSADGTCRTFDASAHGTVFGHGVAVVLLKRLADAVAEGDTILAVIKSTAVNNDGSAKVGYAAPSIQAQADVIALAQATAGVDPESISYIEAHGTGTPLGDPIEIAALTQAFRSGGAKRNGYCAIATGKTYIGHLDVAAGATGLIKTVLQLQHGIIPPLLHFKAPNPKIDFANSPFYPVTRPLEWKRGSQPRRAGISAFGVGGTNAHVIVEEAPQIKPSGPSRSEQLLILSAKTESALKAMSERLAAHLESHPELPLADIAFTLQQGRKPFAFRKAINASNHTDAATLLREPDAKGGHQGKCPSNERAVVFLFPGQGAQYLDMGRDLYERESVFRDAVDRCANILRPNLGVDIRTILFPTAEERAAAETKINETSVTQPSIFVIEYALAQLWMSWGIRPSVLIGHSIGEYVAAVLAESFSLEAALGLLARRALLMQNLPAGSMLAVRLGGAEILPRLPEGVSIAAFNSPKLCTVSGPTPVLKAFQKALEEQKIASRLLPTSHAFHSAMMDPMLPEFAALAAKSPALPPKMAWISTLTGTVMDPAALKDGSYWVRQIREAVRFSDALDSVVADDKYVLLEIGPGQTLSQLARSHARKSPQVSAIPSLGPTDAPGQDLSSMLGALGRLWIAGARVSWPSLMQGEHRRRVHLPTYPFERQRFWVDAVPAQQTSALPTANVSTHGATVIPRPPAETVESPTPSMAPTPNSAPMNAPAPIPSESRRERIASLLRGMVKELSGMEITSPATSFMELGFDSLFLTQASQAFQQKFNVKITFRQMLGDLSSLESIASYIDISLPADALPAPAPAVQAPILAASAQPAAMAIPVFTPTAMTGIPTGGPLMEQLLSQQIQLLQILLAQQRSQGASPSTPARQESSGNSLTAVRWPGAKAPAQTVATAQQEFKRFGPYKPIEKGKKGGLTPTQEVSLNQLISRYVTRTRASKEYTAKHRAHFADPRAVAGFKRNWKEMVYPIVSARSKGSRIWDLDGHEYVDITMGFGTYFFGHSPD